jgi:chaperonin cofactor prefoldin
MTLATLPDIVKVAITVGSTLIALSLAYGSLQSEDVRLHGRIDVVETEEEHVAKDIAEIKQMLREELARHHSEKQ